MKLGKCSHTVIIPICIAYVEVQTTYIKMLNENVKIKFNSSD